MSRSSSLAHLAIAGLLTGACGGANSNGGAGDVSPSDSVPSVSIPDLLGDPTWVGAQVRVTGTCIGYSRVLAAGPQPRTRSDWQLAAAEVAIWVMGPYPEGCSGAAAAPAAATYEMRVAADTLPALGGQAGRQRQYLIYAPRR